ncbi:MAG: alpha/beta hydrolase-fold protein [Planctomycetota bacterium]
MPLAIRRFERAADFSSAAIDGFVDANTFPIVEGTSVTFVFRGGADHVTLQHFVYGLPTSQPFHRVADTDLWYLTLEFPRESRLEYKINVEQGGHGQWIRDPLNDRLARDPFGANSVCTTDGYEVPDWVEPDPEASPGTLQEIQVPSAAFGHTRPVTVYLPHRFRSWRRYPLLIVHDGPDFMRFAAFKTVLDNLIHRLEIAPMIVAMTHSNDRLNEYAADRRHAQFLAQDLVPHLEKHYPLTGTPATRALLGASFGAVASLSSAWYYPEMFDRLVLLSGSFAFTDIGEHTRSPAFDPVVDFVNAFREEPGAAASKVFVGCGVYESLIYENRSLVPILQQAGFDVKYSEDRDGHNWENWRDRLRDALSWVFPGPLWVVYE